MGNAICKGCGKEMSNGNGCLPIEGFERIPYGNEERFQTPAGVTCHDCNVKIGQFHHVNCDMEECPKCGFQLLSCSCEF